MVNCLDIDELEKDGIGKSYIKALKNEGKSPKLPSGQVTINITEKGIEDVKEKKEFNFISYTRNNGHLW